jgi:hypothetical protein
MAACTFTAADVAAWQREVDHWSAVSDAAWDALAAGTSWPRAYARIQAASVALRSLLDLRDFIQAEAQAQAQKTEKFT